MKPTSFLSEHSVELVLVPKLIKILRTGYPVVTPFYYWVSREGGSISAHSFLNKPLRVVALYPRRPKIEQIGDSKVIVKINELLCERAGYFQQKGILPIAGVPLCDRLEDFHMDTECAWFEITRYERTITFYLPPLNKNAELPLLNHSELLALVEKITREISWTQLREIIYKAGRDEIQSHFWNRWSGDLYKPIYLVLH